MSYVSNVLYSQKYGVNQTYNLHCEKIYFLICAPSEDSTQPVFPCSTIRVFIVLASLDIQNVPSEDSDHCANVQDDLNASR